MTDEMQIVQSMCERYQAAVNANDSAAYGKLFATDAVRIPPGSEPEYGAGAISKGEQRDYDVATWSIISRPLDALRVGDDWVFGIAEVDVNTLAHADGATRSFKATKTWLLQMAASGEWLIKRQMWNLR